MKVLGRSKKRRRGGRVLALALAACMTLSTGSIGAMAAEEDGSEAITKTYGDYTFTKVSNPTAGSREPDGINTNDASGFSANRLNSYAWAVASRGDYIYIGTNRTLFGSALNALVEQLQKQNPNLTREKMESAISLISGADVPVGLQDKDYIPQIIRFDVKSGKTKVIYQPNVATGEGGKLYYTAKDGSILPEADVASEAASFRSVIEFNGNLYFGSLGTNMLQLVRIDEDDQAEVVFQTIGLVSSLRAAEVYDDGDCETVYFGGQDTTYRPWLAYRQSHVGEAYPLPIVIRYLDPETAGTDSEDWSGLIADYSDFGKYAYASVYVNGGGTVWDLCSYNGYLYLILAYDGGWAMFRGEKGGSSPNQFGWTWTEVVGDNGKYPLAMNEEVATLNAQYAKDYGCSEYAPGNLSGTGLLESTATPYVYNGKMYIGSFDNATMIQTETVIKSLIKLMSLKNISTDGGIGPSFEQIYAPIYEALSSPQHVWVMDENENITPVDGLNEYLAETTNDYVWRFIEKDGKLYAGTFDSSSAYIYFLDYDMERFVNYLKDSKEDLSEYAQDLLDGNFSTKLKDLLPEVKQNSPAAAAASAATLSAATETVLGAASEVESLIKGETDPEVGTPHWLNMEALKDIDWEEYLNAAKEYIANIYAEAKDLANKALEKATTAAETAIQKAETAAKTYLDKATEKYNGLVEKATEKYNALIEEAKEKYSTLIEEATEKYNTLMEEAKTLAAEKIAEAKAAAEEMLTNAKTAAEEAYTKAKTAAEEAFTKAKAAAEEAFTRAKAAAEEKIAKAKETAAETIAKAKEVAAEKITAAKEAYQKTLAELTEKFAKAKDMISWLMKYFDVKGLTYWAKARALAKNAESGFDLYVSEDGENWEKVVTDGLEDPYNYGARTFTICNGELYLGTANPYFGAQLWKVEYNDNDLSGWEKTKAGWKYRDSEGNYATSEWKEIDGKWYSFDEDSIMEAKAFRDGWYLKKNGAWNGAGKKAAWKTDKTGTRYRMSNGTYLTSTWMKIDGQWYYFNKDGYREENAYRGGYYLDENGVWDGKKAVNGWVQDDGEWWYSLSGKKYLKNCKIMIDGKMYCFHADGFAARNEFVDGLWYGKNCVQSDPAVYSWHTDSKGKWYGIEGGWYAKNASYKIDGKLYTFNAKGYCTN